MTSTSSQLSDAKILSMLEQNSSQLEKNSKKELVSLVNHLSSKIDELQSYKLVADRVRALEKSHVSLLQYVRRESIEIHDIPETVADDQLEETCLSVLEEIGCGKIKPYRVHACHRLKNKKKTVIRFTTRKHADAALHNRGKLKTIDMTKCGLPAEHKVYINESLCPPMQYLFFLARKAYKDKKISNFNLWRGRLTIQLEEDGDKIPIEHIEDLISRGLADEENRKKFLQ